MIKAKAVTAAALGLVLSYSAGAKADITTNSSLTPQQLVELLLGPGITASNITYTGAPIAVGSFNSSNPALDGTGFASGVILSSGNIANVIGPNNSASQGTGNGTPGDPALTTISGNPTFDAAILEFDFVPTLNQISFSYVFGSEEYDEFVQQNVNDSFGFFLNGQNVALLPGTTTPVSIDTVNLGRDGVPGGTGVDADTNSQFYRRNNSPAVFNNELDGLTTVLTVVGNVTPNAVNHIRLAIADGGDSVYDSAVFIQGGSFQAGPPPTQAVPEPGTMTLMGLGLAGLVASRRRKKQQQETSAVAVSA